MLFETDQKKQAHVNGNSLRSTMHKTGTGINKIPVKAVQRSSTSTGNSTSQYRQPVKSAASAHIKKIPAVTPALQKRKIYNSISSAPLKKTMVKTTYYSPGVKKFTPLTSTVKPVRTANSQYSRRAYRGPVVARRGVHIPGRRMYYPRQRIMSPGYTSNTSVRPVNVTVNTPGARYVPGYGYCVQRQTAVHTPPASTIQQQAPVIKNLPVTKKPCHTCGLKTKGCTTISRFAFNSSQLNAVHKKQIHEIALNIIRKNINAIIATGHTDSSGKEDYNEALGARRAGAVVRELRKQLSVLKPHAHKNLFWKILTRGESQPVSKTDAGANRRVHICVRKLAAA
ncbi:MAG: OmpA family protein [Parafilimonas sp.]|nr:OmpA family protein [Parafilimonas sp.]